MYKYVTLRAAIETLWKEIYSKNAIESEGDRVRDATGI